MTMTQYSSFFTSGWTAKLPSHMCKHWRSRSMHVPASNSQPVHTTASNSPDILPIIDISNSPMLASHPYAYSSADGKYGGPESNLEAFDDDSYYALANFNNYKPFPRHHRSQDSWSSQTPTLADLDQSIQRVLAGSARTARPRPVSKIEEEEELQRGKRRSSLFEFPARVIDRIAASATAGSKRQRATSLASTPRNSDAASGVSDEQKKNRPDSLVSVRISLESNLDDQHCQDPFGSSPNCRSYFIDLGDSSSSSTTSSCSAASEESVSKRSASRLRQHIASSSRLRRASRLQNHALQTQTQPSTHQSFLSFTSSSSSTISSSIKTIPPSSTSSSTKNTNAILGRQCPHLFASNNHVTTGQQDRNLQPERPTSVYFSQVPVSKRRLSLGAAAERSSSLPPRPVSVSGTVFTRTASGEKSASLSAKQRPRICAGSGLVQAFVTVQAVPSSESDSRHFARTVGTTSAAITASSSKFKPNVNLAPASASHALVQVSAPNINASVTASASEQTASALDDATAILDWRQFHIDILGDGSVTLMEDES